MRRASASQRAASAPSSYAAIRFLRSSSPSPSGSHDPVAQAIGGRSGGGSLTRPDAESATHDPVVRAYVSNYRDISERVAADRALRESQQRLEFLLSATSAVTYTARTSGEYEATFMGANVKQVLGHEPEAFYVPGFWRENIHPDDAPMIDAELVKMGASDAHSLQYRFRHRDGSYPHRRPIAGHGLRRSHHPPRSSRPSSRETGRLRLDGRRCC